MDTITFFDSRAKFEVKENENNIFVLIFLQKGHFFSQGHCDSTQHTPAVTLLHAQIIQKQPFRIFPQTGCPQTTS